MQWLAGTTALIAGAIAVPTLVLMYFLKLRRTEVNVSSTLLWKRAVQDLRVNAPFQRLRRNLLLLLQLLALLAALVALARPAIMLRPGSAKRYVLLIDRSASMNAREGAATRLELAKTEARKIVDTLRSRTSLALQDASDQAMVIAFADRAKVMSNFTSSKAQLARAIDAIEPTDGGSSLAEAVTVARAFAQPADAPEAGAGAAELDLFSDGRIGDLPQILVNPDEVFFHSIGQATDNVALVAMEARRSYRQADEVTVFATLANYGDRPVSCDVQLTVDADVRAVRRAEVPGRSRGERSAPGRVSVTFNLRHGGAGVVGLQQLRRDALASDDAAWAVLPPPKRLRVLLVSSGNFPLQSALQACPLRELKVLSPGEFDALDHADLSARQPYDVIVLDAHAPEKLPRCRYVVFGRPPKLSGAEPAGPLGPEVLVDWRGRHPVLHHLNLSNLLVAKAIKLKLPRDAVVLAEFGASPAMGLLSRGGSVFLLVGFDVMQTNWPFEPSFVMFCYNAVHFLGMEMAQQQQRSLKPGQTIVVRARPSDRSLQLTGPHGLQADVPCDATGTARFAATRRAGLYTLEVPGRAPERFAVNLLDAPESDIAPVHEVNVSGQKVSAESKAVRRSSEELWPLLVLAVLALACVEWLVYNLKLRL